MSDRLNEPPPHLQQDQLLEERSQWFPIPSQSESLRDAQPPHPSNNPYLSAQWLAARQQGTMDSAHNNPYIPMQQHGPWSSPPSYQHLLGNFKVPAHLNPWHEHQYKNPNQLPNSWLKYAQINPMINDPFFMPPGSAFSIVPLGNPYCRQSASNEITPIFNNIRYEDIASHLEMNKNWPLSPKISPSFSSRGQNIDCPLSTEEERLARALNQLRNGRNERFASIPDAQFSYASGDGTSGLIGGTSDNQTWAIFETMNQGQYCFNLYNGLEAQPSYYSGMCGLPTMSDPPPQTLPGMSSVVLKDSGGSTPMVTSPETENQKLQAQLKETNDKLDRAMTLVKAAGIMGDTEQMKAEMKNKDKIIDNLQKRNEEITQENIEMKKKLEASADVNKIGDGILSEMKAEDIRKLEDERNDFKAKYIKAETSHRHLQNKFDNVEQSAEKSRIVHLAEKMSLGQKLQNACEKLAKFAELSGAEPHAFVEAVLSGSNNAQTPYKFSFSEVAGMEVVPCTPARRGRGRARGVRQTYRPRKIEQSSGAAGDGLNGDEEESTSKKRRRITANRSIVDQSTLLDENRLSSSSRRNPSREAKGHQKYMAEDNHVSPECRTPRRRGPAKRSEADAPAEMEAERPENQEQGQEFQQYLGQQPQFLVDPLLLNQDMFNDQPIDM
ncbi:unnamed protein product [Caenorhabditis sp. 36 PRJEB53466]|nr:unnamed protein product [Caenorhabditis sp. 36 PRJEB53466]